MLSEKKVSKKIKITGIVQGVGFRPFVYNLAKSKNCAGFVINNSVGVIIEIQGNPNNIQDFIDILHTKPPTRSRIDTFQVSELKSNRQFSDFIIKKSVELKNKTVAISPDLNVCDECLHELFDKNNKRYLYPFINCTNCGPRYSIIKDVPYDRPVTTMKNFVMCESCLTEYETPENRRFHAQPNACFSCGPEIILSDNKNINIIRGNNKKDLFRIFQKINEIIRAGKILAIKGIGGFHLACNALDNTAVKNLRTRKIREDKPFAVMFPSIDMVKQYCVTKKEENKLLESYPRPIVLLKKKNNCKIANSVAPHNKFLGSILPYTPIHYILFYFIDFPLVMTSGNISDEPIAFKNSAAKNRLANIADFFLIHNREIHIRNDDSVFRIWKNTPYPLRRSRGYVPNSIILKNKIKFSILACGSEQKNTFGLAKNKQVYISHHIGDLENFETLKAFEQGIDHFKNIFDIEPEIIAYDLHPEYLSTKYALSYAEKNPNGAKIKKIGIQHHHAHAVSCMAENKINEPVIAIILDGTGFGTDSTIWGGEILISEYSGFKRMAHFANVKMPGAKAAVKNPWQMAISYLYEIFGKDLINPEHPFMQSIEPDSLELIIQIIENQINTPITSSCGRLFDAVAAIAGVRNSVNYEGQAAIEFEQYISDNSKTAYNFEIENNGDMQIISWKKMFRQLVSDVKNNISKSQIAGKFHNGLVNILYETVKKISHKTGIKKVVLSGGVFMNLYLLNNLDFILEKNRFKVYTHKSLPTNDGGIALGQIVIANSIIEKENQYGT